MSRLVRSSLLLAAVLPWASCGTVGSGGGSPDGFRDLGGVEHTPLDIGEARANVLIFTTTDCPIANSYVPELNAIRRDYRDRSVRFFLVHVDPDVTPAKARAHAEEFSLDYTILIDRRHELVRALEPTITPEAAVVVEGGVLAYRGRIDNWYGDLGAKRPEPSRRELRDAIDAVLAGKPVAVARTEAVGCYIPELH